MTGPKFNPKDYIISLHEVASSDGEIIPLTTIVPKKYKNKRNKNCKIYIPYKILNLI